MKFKDFIKKRLSKELYSTYLTYDDLMCDRNFCKFISSIFKLPGHLINAEGHYGRNAESMGYNLNDYLFIDFKKAGLSCCKYCIYNSNSYESLIIFLVGTKEEITKISEFYGMYTERMSEYHKHRTQIHNSLGQSDLIIDYEDLKSWNDIKHTCS